MNNFIAALLVALMCLVGTMAHATVPTGVPMFVELARDNPQELQATMVASGAYKPDPGQVYVLIVGMAMHETLKKAGVLKEEMVNLPPAQNPTIETAVREHGQVLSWPAFLERAQAGRFIAPSQVIRPEIWQAYVSQQAGATPVVAAAPAAPAVQAASAPTPQPAVSVDNAALEALKAELVAARRDAATAREVATAQGQANATINGRIGEVDQRARTAEARTEALARQLSELQASAGAQTQAQASAIAQLREEQGTALTAAANLRRETQDAIAAVPALASAAAEGVVGERITPLADRVGGVETEVGRLWLAIIMIAIAVMIGFVATGLIPRYVRKQDAAVLVSAEVKATEVAEKAVKSVRDDLDDLKDSMGYRRVTFAPNFHQKVEELGVTDGTALLTFEVSGCEPTSIVVEHVEVGYVKVTGLPGVSADDKIRLHPPKQSRRRNAVEVLILRLANQRVFDPPAKKSDQAA